MFDYRGRTQLPNAKMSEAPVTLGLRPGYDLPATEKWANRRKNVRLVADVVRLVAEIVGDRKVQISRSKVVVMFKIQSHRCHGLSVYPVCVCNTVRLGQVRSRHNLKPSGTRFECVTELSLHYAGRV